MMKLTPYTNGIHSLAEGLKCLHLFIENNEDPYLMKEVVIKIHHGMETLLKDLLFQRNPIFLLVDKTTISQILDYYKGFYEGRNNYLFDDAKTITPEETISRIKELKIASGISSKDYQQITESFKTLNAIRNQLQHFTIEADSDRIIKVLANLIPGIVNLLKRCYSMRETSNYNPRINIIPHQPLPGMEVLFEYGHNIDKDLNNIYEKSTDVINQLEVKYGRLLNEAIEKLQGSISDTIPLVFKLRNHGGLGPQPDFPEIILEGWLRENLGPHRNAVFPSFSRSNESVLGVYSSSVSVSEPELIESKDEEGLNVVTKVNISSDSSIEVLNSSIFDIPELNELLAFLKSPKLDVALQIECISKGVFNDNFFNVSKVIEIKGFLRVSVISYMYGDAEGKPTVKGVYEIALNNKNTLLKLSSFVSLNKCIEKYSLEIIVDDVANIVFEKRS
ncbi:TPA: hypothetical protein MA071_000573 [Klebsiella pneumoniae]|nr:hypothetical protein [Klebsiella pneumoniae]HDY6303621.1 hypothetical protein [Klebsiella pneumoniae]